MKNDGTRTEKSDEPFSFDSLAESIADPATQDLLKPYTFKVHGSSLFIYSKATNQLVSHFNSFDNSQLIIQSEGYEISTAFGAKRFPIGDAKQEESCKKAGAIQFGRDLQFPLVISEPEPEIPYTIATFDQLLKTRKNLPALYVELAELFNRCSDYTPAKKDEFLAGGPAEDKYCRFNPANTQPESGVVTLNVFLLDPKQNNKVIGTQSATVVAHPNKEVDIYLYDEVVDYFTLMSAEEIQKYTDLCADKPELSDEDKQTPIAKLAESKRAELLAPLFSATRQLLVRQIQTLLPERNQEQIEQMSKEGKIRAMIRAATVWFPYSGTLHCQKDPNGIFVIHGRRTELGNALDVRIKAWAASQLATLKSEHQADTSPRESKKYPKSLVEEVTAEHLDSMSKDDAITGSTQLSI